LQNNHGAYDDYEDGESVMILLEARHEEN
jgi:hypothetical protein